MSPAGPRLFRHARAARGYLIVTVTLGVIVTGMVLAQAEMLARLLAGAARAPTWLPSPRSAALVGSPTVRLL